jgi:gliding motility-associated lipoprotein GldD
MKLLKNNIFTLLIPTLIFFACKPNYTPKPQGYFRIDLPDKEYISFKNECAYSFEYPVYSKLESVQDKDLCWYNLSFNKYNATIHLTYKRINSSDDLIQYTEDIRRIVYKHTIKADAIDESVISDKGMVKYGILYDIKGNTASHVNFFVTDSTTNFVSGSLYFNTSPNYDSLAPLIQFFRKDIVHLIETMSWTK